MASKPRGLRIPAGKVIDRLVDGPTRVEVTVRNEPARALSRPIPARRAKVIRTLPVNRPIDRLDCPPGATP